jgi:hypothetical protein
MTPKPMRPPVLKRRNDPPSVELISTLGKRKFEEAFDKEEYEVDRYGQTIDDKFFVTNCGHAVFQENTVSSDKEGNHNEVNNDNKHVNNNDIYLDVNEVIGWCEYYLQIKRSGKEFY